MVKGATKLVKIEVNGTRQTATHFLQPVNREFNLVKTALFGEDANWGRIIAAAGRSGAQTTRQELVYFSMMYRWLKMAWALENGI